jgi:hypothetical protein
MAAAQYGAGLPTWVDWPKFLEECSEEEPVLPAIGVRAAPPAELFETTGRRRALSIGVGYPNTPVALHGSMNDVTNIYGVLLRLGFSAENTVCLGDGQPNPLFMPTRRNILIAMRWLVHGVVPGDTLFFHFSGLGAQQLDGQLLEDTICPRDWIQEGHITDTQLFSLLVQNLPSGVRLTALLDCCHPGTTLNLPFVCHPQHGWIEEPNPQHTLGDVILLSAFPDDEVPPVEALQARYQAQSGVVTTAFVQALQEMAQRKKGPVTYLELYTQMCAQAEQCRSAWRPRLSASQAFDPAVRTFRFSDAIPNGNRVVGLRYQRRTKRPRHWYQSDPLPQALNRLSPGVVA